MICLAQDDKGIMKTIKVPGGGWESPQEGDKVTGMSLVAAEFAMIVR